jgi:hypothetical protein
MATVEQRYETASEYVKRAIRTVELGALHSWGSILPAVFATETYAGQVKTESAKRDLAQVEARWLRAASDIDRARVARDAELLADRVAENLPGAPTDWSRTNLYPGEGARTTSASTYASEAQVQVEGAWSWIKREAGEAIDETKTIGRWLLVGGGVLLGIKLVEYLDERERRRDRSRATSDPRRALNAALERAAHSPKVPS